MRTEEVKMNKQNGFTLAEVLITLGIIGVVAAMTLPALIAKYQKTVVLTSLKKNYASLQAATQYSVSKYGEPLYWEGLEPWMTSTLCKNNLCDEFVDKFLENVKTAKVYEAKHVPTFGVFEFCGSDKVYKTLTDDTRAVAAGSGDARQNYKSVLLPDGSCWLFYFRGAGTELNTSLMLILVDVNGPDKRPNRYGADTFKFELFGNGKLAPQTVDDCRKVLNDTGMGQGCAHKIAKDGWQIKNDYYWKF